LLRTTPMNSIALLTPNYVPAAKTVLFHRHHGVAPRTPSTTPHRPLLQDRRKHLPLKVIRRRFATASQAGRIAVTKAPRRRWLGGRIRRRRAVAGPRRCQGDH
jgi:hypothetical protein